MSAAPAPPAAARRSLLGSAVLHGLSSASSLFLFALLILAGRVLGAADFGRFSFAMAFVFLFDFLLDPGLYHYLIREMAREPGRAGELLGRALAWKLAMAVPLCAVVFFAAGFIADDARSLQAVALMSVAHVLRSLKDGLRAPLLASERFDVEAASVAGERLALLVAGGASLALGGGLIGLCATFVAVRVVDVGVLSLLVARTTCRVRLAFDAPELRRMLVQAAPIGLFYATLTLYNYVDTVMIRGFHGDVQVGLYNAAYRIYEGALMLPAIVSMVLMPRLSVAAHARAQGDASSDFEQLYARGLKYAVLLGLCVGACGFAASGPIVELAFGQDYAAAAPAFLALMLGLAPVFALNLQQTVLIALDRQRTLVVASLVGLVLNATLNALLLPHYGFVAAAWVTVGVETAVLVGLLAVLHGVLPGRALWTSLLRPIAVVAAVTAGICLAVAPDRPILRLLGLAACLPPALWATGHLLADERQAIAALLRRRRAARSDPGEAGQRDEGRADRSRPQAEE